MRLDGLAVGAAYARAAWRSWGDGPRAQPAAGWLEGAARALTEKPEILRLLLHPAVDDEERLSVVARLAAAAGGDADFERYLALVVANRQVEHLGEIADAYRELADGARGVRRGVLETARPLEPGRLDAYADRLGKALGGEVRLESRVVPELLGGFRLRLGREMADASVRHALQGVEAALAGR